MSNVRIMRFSTFNTVSLTAKFEGDSLDLGVRVVFDFLLGAISRQRVKIKLRSQVVTNMTGFRSEQKSDLELP